MMKSSVLFVLSVTLLKKTMLTEGWVSDYDDQPDQDIGDYSFSDDSFFDISMFRNAFREPFLNGSVDDGSPPGSSDGDSASEGSFLGLGEVLSNYSNDGVSTYEDSFNSDSVHGPFKSGSHFDASDQHVSTSGGSNWWKA